MERKFFWSLGILVVLAIVGSFFMPSPPNDKADLPWHIEHPAPDTTRIFGVTLGQSTTNDAEQHFRELAKPSLFKSQDGRLVAEMFFEQVNLAGLKAKIILSIAAPDAELLEMYERGLRMTATESGKQITLTPDDITRLRTLPVASLTYLPSVRLDEEIIRKRFGQPSQRIKEKKSAAVHWLYPQHGLDIASGGEEKAVLQFVPPKDFNKLAQPLLANGEILP